MRAEDVEQNLVCVKNKFLELKELYSELSFYGAFYKDALLISYGKEIYSNCQKILTDYEENKNLDECVQSLVTLLEKNWTLVKGTALSYLTIPDHPATALLCECAKFVAYHDHSFFTAIQALMPDVVCTDETLDMPLERTLVTHVLTHSGTYLVDVGCVRCLADPEFEQLRNPAVGHAAGIARNDEDYFINSDADLSKLLHHSPAIEEIYDLYLDFIAAKQQSLSLAGEITRLLSRLYVNSKYGAGHEEVAGAGGASAIAQFFKFYDRLPEVKKNRLPESLREQIILLARCIDHDDWRREELDPMETCLATRREKLDNACRGHDALLQRIGLEEDVKNDAIEQAKTKLANAIAKFDTTLKNCTYAGNEPNSYTTELFSQLNITISFDSFDRIEQFMSQFTAKEAQPFFAENNYTLTRQAVDRLTLDDLVLLGHNVPIETYCSLLSAIIAAGRQDTFILNTSKLCELLLSFESAEKIEKIFVAFELQNFIKTTQDFIDTLKALTPLQTTALFNAAQSQNKLLGESGLIRNITEFTTILCALPNNKQTAVLDAAQNQRWLFGQHGLIQNTQDFLDVLDAALTPLQTTALFNAAQSQNKLLGESGLIRNITEFTTILCALPNNKQTAVLDAAQNQRWLFGQHGLIQNAQDFSKIANFLPEEQTKELIQVVHQRHRAGKMQKKQKDEFIFASKKSNFFKDHVRHFIHSLGNDSYTLGLFTREYIQGKRVPKNVAKIIRTCHNERNPISSYEDFVKLSAKVRDIAREAAANPPTYFCGLWKPRDPATQSLYEALAKNSKLPSEILKISSS